MEKLDREELMPCPECGDVPEIQYACGEYFLINPLHRSKRCFCNDFPEMHSSEEYEIECWNKAVKEYYI